MPFEPEKILTQGAIFAIHADREKTLWIGGEKGLRGLKDGVLKKLTIADGLAGNDVKVIIDATSGRNLDRNIRRLVAVSKRTFDKLDGKRRLTELYNSRAL